MLTYLENCVLSNCVITIFLQTFMTHLLQCLPCALEQAESVRVSDC